MVKPHIVIIGGGFGGLTVARHLAKAPVRITLIDRSNHHLFQPLLYQVATAGLSPANIAMPIRSVLRRQENTEVLMAEVIGINSQEKKVITHHHQVPYDQLVIATGSWYSFFGHDEWKKYTQGLKSIADATDIRRKILMAFEAAEIEPNPEIKKVLLTFVLVGAGPTGVEMAGSIAELAHHALASDFRHVDPRMARIILIEAGKRILASFSDDLALKATAKLQDLGVEIRTETRVKEIDSCGVYFKGEFIPAKTVIWSAGVVASPAGKWLGVETDRAGRVVVNSDLSVPGHPDIFAIGDTVSFIQDGKPLPGVAPVAMQEGKYIGRLIEARLKGKVKSRPFHYINKGNLATVGRSFAIADLGKVRLTGQIAWLAWLVVHIYYLIGFRNRILVIIEWAWAFFTFQRGARLITGSESTDF